MMPRVHQQRPISLMYLYLIGSPSLIYYLSTGDCLFTIESLLESPYSQLHIIVLHVYVGNGYLL